MGKWDAIHGSKEADLSQESIADAGATVVPEAQREYVGSPQLQALLAQALASPTVRRARQRGAS